MIIQQYCQYLVIGLYELIDGVERQMDDGQSGIIISFLFCHCYMEKKKKCFIHRSSYEKKNTLLHFIRTCLPPLRGFSNLRPTSCRTFHCDIPLDGKRSSEEALFNGYMTRVSERNHLVFGTASHVVVFFFPPPQRERGFILTLWLSERQHNVSVSILHLAGAISPPTQLLHWRRAGTRNSLGTHSHGSRRRRRCKEQPWNDCGADALFGFGGGGAGQGG